MLYFNIDRNGFLPKVWIFYIPKLNVGIEYQGIQHYTDVDFLEERKHWSIEKFSMRKNAKYVKIRGSFWLNGNTTLTLQTKIYRLYCGMP